MQHKFLFFGTDSFVVPVLAALLTLPRESFVCVGVVTAPDRKGRGKKTIPSPVKIFAEENTLRVFTPEKLRDFFDVYAHELQPSFSVVASYGKIIPQTFIDATPHGILNIHPSILPKHRGPSPVPSTILNGDTTTGVSIMKIDSGVDTGDIISMEKVALAGNETTPQLLLKLFTLGATLLQKVLSKYLEGSLVPVPQESKGATHTKMFTKEDGRLSFEEPADILERKIRALNPWPSTFTTLNDKAIKILQAKIAPTLKKALSPGTISIENEQLFVGTATLPLQILELQEEGKRPQPTQEFLRGHSIDSKKFA